MYRYNHPTDLLYQKYVLYIDVGLWIGDCVKVKPDGSCHYEAAKTQSGIYALVGSAVSHFADNIYTSKKCTYAWGEFRKVQHKSSSAIMY